MIEPFLGLMPRLDASNFVASTALVLGDVTLGPGTSIWYGAALRGDVNYILIGEASNVQDCAVVHVSRGTHPCVLGDRVTIGHSAVVHGCTIEDDVLIGIGAVVLDGAVVGAGSLVGAKALVPPGAVIPPRSLVMGIPGKVVRTLTDAEVERNRANAAHYVRMSRMFMGVDTPDTNPFYDRAAGPSGTP